MTNVCVIGCLIITSVLAGMLLQYVWSFVVDVVYESKHTEEE